MISFVIPACNAETTLERAIRSILDIQANKEILVVENGSSDHTAEIAGGFSEVRLLHSEKGVSKARNVGIENAAGDWICFVDADDEVLLGIQNVLSEIEATQPDICIASYQKGDALVRIDYQSGKLLAGPTMEQAFAWLLTMPTQRMTCWAKLYKRSFLVKHSLLFDEALSYSEDSEFLIRVLQTAGSLQFSATPIYHYRTDTSSSVRSYKPERMQQYLTALHTAAKGIGTASNPIQNAFQDYTIAQLNLIAVHDIFGFDVEMSKEEKRQKLQSLLRDSNIKQAIQDFQATDLLHLNNIPAILFSHGMPSLGGWICYLRSLKNR